MRKTMLMVSAAGMVTCIPPGHAADPSPQALVDRLTGDAVGAAAGNPQCGLFSAEEIAGYLGAAVGPGENATMGMGCQWVAVGGGGDVMVVVVPAEYAERPSEAPGFKEVATVGPSVFVVPEMGGWAAGATTGDSFVKVSVAGPGASEEAALTLLADTISRRKP